MIEKNEAHQHRRCEQRGSNHGQSDFGRAYLPGHNAGLSGGTQVRPDRRPAGAGKPDPDGSGERPYRRQRGQHRPGTEKTGERRDPAGEDRERRLRQHGPEHPERLRGGRTDCRRRRLHGLYGCAGRAGDRPDFPAQSRRERYLFRRGHPGGSPGGDGRSHRGGLHPLSVRRL